MKQITSKHHMPVVQSGIGIRFDDIGLDVFVFFSCEFTLALGKKRQITEKTNCTIIGYKGEECKFHVVGSTVRNPKDVGDKRLAEELALRKALRIGKGIIDKHVRGLLYLWIVKKLFYK